MVETAKTIVDILQHRASTNPNKVIFTFLKDGQQASDYLTYQSLDQQSRTIAAALQQRKLNGERAILFFPQGLAFISAFFGCLYAGVIAVPSYPPGRNKMNRLNTILADCDAKIILSNKNIFNKSQKIAPDFFKQEWLLTDELPQEAYRTTSYLPHKKIAYLQYTSGSTGNPKGVMISHKNILHNSAFFKEVYQLTTKDCCVSWAPLFHDMGLIDGIFSPIYSNYPLILMSPYDFIQRPIRWLEAMSNHKATKSGGPNFAYDLCVEKIAAAEIESLDLSQVKCLFNGAEPIRQMTHQQFLQKFESTGLRKEVFNPGYGLAETTLQVIGVNLEQVPATVTVDKNALVNNRVLPITNIETGQTFVSSGYPRLGLLVKIVHPETFHLAAADEVGEIWVKGDSVAAGYWNNPEATKNTFNQIIQNTRETGYLRTGDLGFAFNGEIYITGRIKDLIILNGKNYYPADIERIIESAHPALEIGNTIAFSIFLQKEKIVAVQGLKRTFFRRVNTQEIIQSIREKIADTLEITIHQIILIRPHSIPKTSSGKLMRRQCKAQFQEGSLKIIDQWIAPAIKEKIITANSIINIKEEVDLQNYLRHLIAKKSNYELAKIDKDTSIIDIGLDSINVVEIAADLEKIIDTKLDPSLFWEFKTVEKIAHFIFHQKMNSTNLI